MNDIAQKITLYHNIFQICLILSIICLVIAIVLFFVLDIKTVIGYLTGRSAKKKIKELEESNAASGRLFRKEKTKLQYANDTMKKDMGGVQQNTPGARKVANVVDAPATQQPVQSAQPQAEVTAETSVLQASEGETSVLQEDWNGMTSKLSNQTAVTGTFVIEREYILIHTDEVL